MKIVTPLRYMVVLPQPYMVVVVSSPNITAPLVEVEMW